MSVLELPDHPQDRSHRKYVLAEDDNVAVRVFAPPQNFGSIGNLSEIQDDAVVVPNLGYNTIGFYCSPPTGGTIIFETTFDGINWEATTIRGVTSDELSSRITAEGNFIGSVSTNRAIRFRTEVAGSAVGTVMGRFQRDASIIEHVEFGHPPHKVGYTTVRKHDAFTTAQTDEPIWTPPSGMAIVVTDLFIFAYGSTDGRITVFINNNVNGNLVFNTEVSVSVIGPFSFNHTYKLGIVGAVDEVLKITTSAAINCDIMAHGYEI